MNQRTDAHRARALAIAAIAVAVVLAFLPGSSEAAVAHHPQPSQGRVIDYPNGAVIHLFAHPVGPVPPPTGPGAQTAATSHNLYLICETSLNPTHCLALDSASTTILVTALITTICQFVDCPELLRAVTSRGSNNDKGDVTFQAEGSYTGHDSDFFHDCVGAAPNAADQHDNVYWSQPSRCFGPLYQSWKYEIEPGKGYRYDMINRYADTHLHQVLVMANLNTRQGAYLYVKPNVQPGLWTTWGFYQVGTCNPC
jgi:hypothetical protein